MTNEEFLQEALESEGCPKDFQKIYHVFSTYQRIVQDTLREFKRVCDIHDIHYQLAFGSMIGAIRDNGQIPWDYDADVIVPFYEKDHLIECLKNDLKKDFYFLSGETSDRYAQYFVRVVPKGYPHEMLHVDVYYAVGIPNAEPERAKYVKEVKEKYNARRFIMLNIHDNPFTMQGRIKRTILKIFYKLRYFNQNINDLSSIFNKYDIRNTNDAITVSMRIAKRIYPSHIFLNSINIETREGTFRIPADYEGFLKIYGNWRAYFPIKNRIAEVVSHYNHFRWYKEHNMLPADAPDI